MLGLSLGFAPSGAWNKDEVASEVHVAHTRMMRNLYLSDYFSEEPPGERYGGTDYGFVDGKAPSRFRVPSTDWHPLQQQGAALRRATRVKRSHGTPHRPRARNGYGTFDVVLAS